MLKIKELEHVLIGKVGQLFRNMLSPCLRNSFPNNPFRRLAALRRVKPLYFAGGRARIAPVWAGRGAAFLRPAPIAYRNRGFG
jgi:hypothetical protein